MSDATVGVIIPMFNAARTIEETLASVCAQTHCDLDVVVVDDGSTDESPGMVERWADPRVRLLTQKNAGVAAARNYGAAATNAPYLAFLDADDVWYPTKTQVQLKVLIQSPDALVWCWYHEIDDEGGISDSPDLSSGETFRDLCVWNIVANGSSMLVSRRAFEESGGFDTTLRDRDAQGCEDYSFALRVAEKFPMKLIRERLVGYRVSSASMSTNTLRMWRSHTLVIDEFAVKYSEYTKEFELNRELALMGYYYRSLKVCDFKAALWFLQMLRQQNAIKPDMQWNFVKSWLRSKLIGTRAVPQFKRVP